MELLDQLNALTTQALGPFGPLIAVGVLGMFLILLTLPVLLKKRVDPLDKLKQETRAPKGDGPKLRNRGSKSQKLEKYSNFLEPKDAEEYTAARLYLLQAGYRSKDAVRTYHFLQFALGLAFLTIGALIALMNAANADEPNMQMTLITAFFPGLVGYIIPKWWVRKRVEKRQKEITNGFPDALDMMLVCVEAGQSLDQSIIRVAKEIRAGYPSLADEFETVSYEMKAGKEKTAVLRDMSERAGVQDVSSFVTVLIQSTAFGTSIADALRVYASEMRDKRVMRAEEKANTLPTKMTLATMMLTVPPLLLILIGPSVYSVIITLGDM